MLNKLHHYQTSKKIIIAVLFFFCCGKIVGQSNWVYVITNYGIDTLRCDNAIAFDKFNRPWIYGVDIGPTSNYSLYNYNGFNWQKHLLK